MSDAISLELAENILVCICLASPIADQQGVDSLSCATSKG